MRKRGLFFSLFRFSFIGGLSLFPNLLPARPADWEARTERPNGVADTLTVPVFQIQGEGEVSPYSDSVLWTEGVVTLTLFGEGQLGGFFIQDTLGDGNPETSDGLFVYGKAEVESGNYVVVKGKVGEYDRRTQMSRVEVLRICRKGVEIPCLEVRFPEDIAGREESLEGMALLIPDTLYLIGTRNLQYEGSLVLGSTRHRAPTDYNLPGSGEADTAKAFNVSDRLVLDDGSLYRPQDMPFLDSDGTCRTGRWVAGFSCVLDQVDAQYRIYARDSGPVFRGNPRTGAPDEAELGNYDAKICGFNLEYFMNESDLQRTRIVKALTAIDADVYGLVEVGGGSQVIECLVDELNAANGSRTYDFVRWSGYEPTSGYTLNHIVYDKDKWEPYREYYMINTPSPYNRKLIQALRSRQGGFTFIYSINHFKAKSGNGSGADADQGDGQGVYNATRVKEAYAVRDKLDLVQYYYGTGNVLVMGDLNALYREDPIRVFLDAGYAEQIHRFRSDSYSYCYDDCVQYLDYALASASMELHVTGATVWHINSDEPSFLDYDRNQGGDGPYRCSDHDPVVVGISFTTTSQDTSPSVIGTEKDSGILEIYPNPSAGKVFLKTEGRGELEICSASGHRVYREKTEGGETVLDVSLWAEGIYLVLFRSESGRCSYGKLVRAACAR